MSQNNKGRMIQHGGTKISSQQQSLGNQKNNNTTFGEQVNTINGTGDINYNQTNQSNQLSGPQITFDKHYLCMKEEVGNISQDRVVVTNVGTTTVTYDWKKVVRGDFILAKSSDGIQRFYCHYPRGILKPGESKSFTFSFRSAEKPGMFNEEWELLTEPLLMQPLPYLYLSGMATKLDSRNYYYEQNLGILQSAIKDTIVKETFEDIFDKVKSPTPPPPNMRDPEVFRPYFEKNNKHLGLFFTQFTMDQLYELLGDIGNRLGMQSNEDGQQLFSEWDGKIEFLEDLIDKIPNKYSKQTLKDRYIQILYNAKKVPTDRAQSYPVFRSLLLSLSEHTIEFDIKGREELQMIENLGFIVPHENITDEEIKKIEDEKKLKKADWLKKTKKKPKTDDEEYQEQEELKSKIGQALKSDLLQHQIEKAEKDVEIVKTKWLIENHVKMDLNQYDELYRLESILDTNISGQDIILRLDLDVPLSPYVAPQQVTQGNTQDDHQKSQPTSRVKKTTQLQQQQQQEALNQSQQQQEDPWKKRDILDHTLIKKAIVDLRYCIEHYANRTFIIGNLGEKCGKIKHENSMKIVFNVLQQQLIEQQMIFVPDAIIKNFEQRKENEEFQESTTFMLENLNFKPDEYGYVEPDKPPEEPKPSEEELKRMEEEKQKDLAAQNQKPGAKGQAPAKQAPADKKKQEEEAKKKLEEELALKKKLEEQNAQKAMSEEEKQEAQRKKEEAERLKKEMEYFDYKTIHKYKENLGKYGEIFVNDAPLMTLSSSNSIAETRCKKKVMGVRMTEEIRKICLFFLKKHPKDIKNQWYTPPPLMGYHDINCYAILGGTMRSVQDILDRILLINALFDTCKHIHLIGELGLAGLYALGIKVGRVDRPGDNSKDYEQAKEFFLNLFDKAVESGVRIYFPCDFLVSQKYEIEDSVKDGDHQHATGGQSQQPHGTKMEKTQQSRLNMSQQNEDEFTKKSGQQMKQEQPAWKPYHWADKIIDKSKHREVKILLTVQTKWNDIVTKYFDKCKKNGEVESYIEHPTSFEKTNLLWAQPSETDSENKESENIDIETDEYVLEYGDNTREILFKKLNSTFKLFWDGSLSIFKDAVLASKTNKMMVQNLLDLRQRTQTDDEPPVTLLHGSETETVLRHALMRIKVEQQEAAEALKRKAIEDGEEIEEDEDQITMTQDESKEEASTFQQDYNALADFFCFEVPQFTMKIMQGVPNRSLLNLNQHPKKTKEQEEEDLFLLDEI